MRWICASPKSFFWHHWCHSLESGAKSGTTGTKSRLWCQKMMLFRLVFVPLVSKILPRIMYLMFLAGTTAGIIFSSFTYPCIDLCLASAFALIWLLSLFQCFCSHFGYNCNTVLLQHSDLAFSSVFIPLVMHLQIQFLYEMQKLLELLFYHISEKVVYAATLYHNFNGCASCIMTKVKFISHFKPQSDIIINIIYLLQQILKSTSRKFKS